MLGESIEVAVVESGGFVGDRGYALVDAVDGKVASAKHPRKWGSLLGCAARYVGEPQPGAPLPPVVITFPDGTETRTDHPACNGTLSAFTGREVTLANSAPSDRTFDEVWPAVDGLAPEEFIASTTTATTEDGESISTLALGLAAPPGTFFDLSVLHVITTATLAKLAALAPAAKFDVRRYRPNVLVAVEGEAFEENDWVGCHIRFGDEAEASVTLPTMRCVMTTLAQPELPADRDTLRTIAAHNRIEIAGLGSWACAGVYADVAQPGTIRTGDPVTVIT
jgi:uncharacterized protein YcbX